jgi:hypothetical protein
LTGVAVNVTDDPAQTVVNGVEIDKDGTTVVVIVMMM